MKITGREKKFYAFIGGMSKWSSKSGPNSGGFNSGGKGGEDIESDNMESDDASVGGATNPRLTKECTSSIIVAAACTCSGAPGGELTGYYAESNDNFPPSNYVAQTEGVLDGAGENGIDSTWTPGSGGGCGWRGGIKGTYSKHFNYSYLAAAHSGSSSCT